MIDTRPHSPAHTAELLVNLLVGADSVDRVANQLDVPPGQVYGWCDRVRTALTLPGREDPTWRSEHGEVAVSHTAHHAVPLSIGTLITFTVVVHNSSPATLYGVHLIQRGFTNSEMEPLEFERSWQFRGGNHAQLAPGQTHRYTATYRLMQDDLTADGDIINAIAISGRTATGQHFYAERDAILELHPPSDENQPWDPIGE